MEKDSQSIDQSPVVFFKCKNAMWLVIVVL
jgi:hypothetical protein